MKQRIILAKRPDLVLKLEKYGLVPEGKKHGMYAGCAKKWAQEKLPPYDEPVYQALAERLPIGWEEITREELKDLLEKLEKVINQKKSAAGIPNKGNEKMLKNLVQTAILGLASAATLILENGIGILPGDDEAELRRAKELSFELVLHLISGSGFLERLFRSIGEITDAKSEDQAFIGKLLHAAACYIALLTAADGNEDKMKHYFSNFKHLFSSGVRAAETFLTEKLIDESLEGDITEKIALCTRQARLAIDKDDYEGFNEALGRALAALDISPERFNDDVRKIRSFALNLHRMIKASLDDKSNKLTALSQAM